SVCEDRGGPGEQFLPCVVQRLPHTANTLGQQPVVAPEGDDIPWLHLPQSELEVLQHPHAAAGSYVPDPPTLPGGALDNVARPVAAPIVRHHHLEVVIVLERARPKRMVEVLRPVLGGDDYREECVLVGARHGVTLGRGEDPVEANSQATEG